MARPVSHGHFQSFFNSQLAYMTLAEQMYKEIVSSAYCTVYTDLACNNYSNTSQNKLRKLQDKATRTLKSHIAMEHHLMLSEPRTLYDDVSCESKWIF